MNKRIHGLVTVGMALSLAMSGQVAFAAQPAGPLKALAFLPGSDRIDSMAETHRQHNVTVGDGALRQVEREPVGTKGINDTEVTAEPVVRFGTRPWQNPQVTITGDLTSDTDFYAVELRAGDVLSGSVTGAATRLTVHDPTHREVYGTSVDESGIYPKTSPLLGGGNATVDFVAPRAGRYTVGTLNGQGAYTLNLKALRPGTETAPRGSVPTLFLDFNGALIAQDIFGTEGDRQLSPFSSFLAKWGLTAADESAVIDRVLATIRENYLGDVAHNGTNPQFALRILNSRDNADAFGKPGVSRVVVGGTVDEFGFTTVGLAQSIDPGNFAQEETAVVLLDRLSGPAGPAVSLNTYITDKSDRVAFVGRAIGNVASHEIGHMSGNWHTNPDDTVLTLMDQRGNQKEMFEVGPDGVGGTADDVDYDFGEDTFAPDEGISGTEDTLNRLAWAYHRGTA